MHVVTYLGHVLDSESLCSLLLGEDPSSRNKEEEESKVSLPPSLLTSYSFETDAIPPVCYPIPSSCQ